MIATAGGRIIRVRRRRRSGLGDSGKNCLRLPASSDLLSLLSALRRPFLSTLLSAQVFFSSRTRFFRHRSLTKNAPPQVMATCAVQAGAELLNSYGPLPSSVFLLKYGVVDLSMATGPVGGQPK